MYVFVVCSAYLALIIYLFLYLIHVVLILFVHFYIPEEIWSFFLSCLAPNHWKNDLFNSPSDTVSNCSNGNPARAEIGAELSCTAFIHFPVVNLRYFLFYFGHFFSRNYCFLAFCYNCLCSKLNQILSKSSNFHTICRFSRISISSGS